MIVYLDTSSLVKLYLPSESNGDEVRQTLDAADTAATSAIAYVEALSAFTRQRRERRLSMSVFDVIKSDFEQDWFHYQIVHVTMPLLSEAGRLAERHALRALDAIHLASYLELFRSTDGAVELSTYDRQLGIAARSATRMRRR